MAFRRFNKSIVALSKVAEKSTPTSPRHINALSPLLRDARARYIDVITQTKVMEQQLPMVGVHERINLEAINDSILNGYAIMVKVQLRLTYCKVLAAEEAKSEKVDTSKTLHLLQEKLRSDSSGAAQAFSNGMRGIADLYCDLRNFPSLLWKDVVTFEDMAEPLHSIRETHLELTLQWAACILYANHEGDDAMLQEVEERTSGLKPAIDLYHLVECMFAAAKADQQRYIAAESAENR